MGNETIGVSRQTVMSLCRALQLNAEAMQPSSALPDTVVETDEMFQNAGKKGITIRTPKPHRGDVTTNVEATVPIDRYYTQSCFREWPKFPVAVQFNRSICNCLSFYSILLVKGCRLAVNRLTNNQQSKIKN